MRKKLFFASLVVFACLRAAAQEQAIVQEGEYGFQIGAAHYFGDLNPNPRFNRPGPSFGAFFRKNFNDYVALRVSANYAFLGYSDKYNSYNEFMYRRNLSFNTNIWELAVQGDFNFLKYVPGSWDHRFTPYITFGLGVFNYNPYTYYEGQKVYLRPLGTEGQGTAGYPKEYSTMAVCFPIGAGVKYSLNRRMNLGFELLYRFTTTDYIDDVSGTYAPDAQAHYLPNGQPTLWYALEDRSYATGDGTRIGIQGRQRGYSNQKDSYLTAVLSLSFNLTSYKCPSAK